MMRFWDVSEGAVLVGGRDVRDLTCNGLLKNFSAVFQNVYLFNDTIEGNIRFGKPSATHEEVLDAARRAQVDEFVRDLPDGYATVVGEGGNAFSGGQKQRISIARALLQGRSHRRFGRGHGKHRPRERSLDPSGAFGTHPGKDRGRDSPQAGNRRTCRPDPRAGRRSRRAARHAQKSSLHKRGSIATSSG